jgi:hypothetical protein
VSRFIDEHRGRFGVEPICRVLGVSASPYYQRETGERSARAVEDERLLGVIGEQHAANYFAYGYRRMWKALLRSGEDVGRDRVKRLLRAEGIQGASAVASRGAPRAPIPTRAGGPIWCAATSARRHLIGCGSPICLTCAAGRARGSSPSSSTPTPGGWSAGSWRRTCAPRWSSTRCVRRWAPARPAPTSRWCTTAIAAASPDSSGHRNSVRGINLSIQAAAVSELAPQRLPAGRCGWRRGGSPGGRAGAAIAACVPVGPPAGARFRPPSSRARRALRRAFASRASFSDGC